MFKKNDYFNKEAKKLGYKARSVFKLMEIDKKYNIFNGVNYVLDLGCAPGSWIQYAYEKIKGKKIIIGIDLNKVDLNLQGVYTFVEDVTNLEKVYSIIDNFGIKKFDLIMSDLAPKTIGISDVDAIRSINLLNEIFPIFERYKPTKFIIKLFMGSGFDAFLTKVKIIFGGKYIKFLKPSASRKNSKEIYLIKYN